MYPTVCYTFHNRCKYLSFLRYSHLLLPLLATTEYPICSQTPRCSLSLNCRVTSYASRSSADVPVPACDLFIICSVVFIIHICFPPMKNRCEAICRDGFYLLRVHRPQVRVYIRYAIGTRYAIYLLHVHLFS
jgi:hypothetical protein